MSRVASESFITLLHKSKDRCNLGLHAADNKEKLLRQHLSLVREAVLTGQEHFFSWWDWKFLVNVLLVHSGSQLFYHVKP